MNLQEEVDYAIDTIKTASNLAVKGSHDVLMMQLTNDNHGFSSEAISKIRKLVQTLQFLLPTHISILAKGKETSSVYLYDGLKEIYCNDSELKKVWVNMRQRRL